MGNAIRKNVNSIRDEYNGRRRRTTAYLGQDPPTTPTTFGTKFIIVGSGSRKMKYPLPINTQEKKLWLEDQHYIIRHMWQNNFSSPVRDILKRGGANVLDIGCGTGTWLFEMAKDFPKSNFIGVDIAPIFPANHNEKNLEFKLANILEGLPFEDNTFDLVFARLVGDTFSEKEWEESVLRELLRLTKPGFYLEIMQTDSNFSRCGENLERWNQALLAININNSSVCEKFETWLLNESQVSSMNHEIAISPIGTWAGKTGEFGVSYIRHLSSKMRPQLIRHLEMTDQEYDRMMERAEQEYNEFTTFRTSHRFIAQKKRNSQIVVN